MNKTIDYTNVTELPGNKMTEEQFKRLYQRYCFASLFCEGKEVLEVACGAGMGLGYLAAKAKKVVGADIDENNLKFAQDHYAGRRNIELKILDAHKLFFEDKSFDVVMMYEAIYYLTHPEKFIDEACRVLRENGKLIICTVNRDWADFNPSPHSIEYFSVPELYHLLNKKFSKVEIFGGFQTSANSPRDKIISLIKRLAVTLGLMPRTMKGKEKLKRIFLGRLIPIPAEIEEGTVEYYPPVSISCDCPNSGYKVIFVVGYV